MLHSTEQTAYDSRAESQNWLFKAKNGIEEHMLVNSHRLPKNIWDGVCMPLGIAIAWYLFSKPIFILRQTGMPADTFFASNASELSGLLFYLGVGMVALGPGMILSNWIQWVLPYTRNQQNQLNGGRGEEVIRQANRSLVKFSIPLFVFLYPLSFFGGLNYFALSPAGVFYRPWFATHSVKYDWMQITGISTACWIGSKSPNGRYVFRFNDDRNVDLIAMSTRDFFLNYPSISKYLDGVPFNFYFDEQLSKSCPQSWRPYFQHRP
jgi:hypothetical protein